VAWRKELFFSWHACTYETSRCTFYYTPLCVYTPLYAYMDVYGLKYTLISAILHIWLGGNLTRCFFIPQQHKNKESVCVSLFSLSMPCDGMLARGWEAIRPPSLLIFPVVASHRPTSSSC
jgi:hypothetical protein